MTQDEIIAMAYQASKEWAKEYPTPEETANPVPKRFLEIFAKLIAEKEREACAKECERMMMYPTARQASAAHQNVWEAAAAIRARGQE